MMGGNGPEAPDGRKVARYAMVIDLDRCSGCGACMVACAVDNNVAPAEPRATDRTGTTWMRVAEMRNGDVFPASRTAFVPIPCQQCDNPPCESVCPQKAVECDAATGIVGQVPVRCLGCRYCMVACPYHARAFNWWDPSWPEGLEAALNPDVSPRMRGVVEKCNFCHHRLQAARARAAHEGREVAPGEYVPACVEACPTRAIVFGDLREPDGEAARLAARDDSFRFLDRLGTEPKVFYRSRQPWVREAAGRQAPHPGEEVARG